MSVREPKEQLFDNWESYLNWYAEKSKDSSIRVCGLSEADDKIKASFIELY